MWLLFVVHAEVKTATGQVNAANVNVLTVTH